MESALTDKENSFAFWKNLVLIVFFLTVTPIALGTSMFSLWSLSKLSSNPPSKNTESVLSYQKSGVKVFASLPNTFSAVSGQVNPADARAELVRQYLENYNSPIEPLAPFIVTTADKYGLDYRLITAIAQQESNLCKIIPPGGYNCWGWGIHSKGTLGFSSFEEGIETVSKGLREEYLDKGYSTVEEIMSKYTPLSNGSWAYGVNKFMSEME